MDPTRANGMPGPYGGSWNPAGDNQPAPPTIQPLPLPGAKPFGTRKTVPMGANGMDNPTSGSSGMYDALSAHADKMHPVPKRDASLRKSGY
jgi:hypothetical protein